MNRLGILSFLLILYSVNAVAAPSAMVNDLNQHLTEIADQQVKRILGSTQAWVNIELKVTDQSIESKFKLPLSNSFINTNQIIDNENSPNQWMSLLPDVSSLTINVLVSESINEPVRKILNTELEKVYKELGTKNTQIKISNAPAELSGLWLEQNHPVIKQDKESIFNLNNIMIGIAFMIFLSLACFFGIYIGMKKMQGAFKDLIPKQDSTVTASGFNAAAFAPNAFAPPNNSGSNQGSITNVNLSNQEKDEHFWNRIHPDMIISFIYDLMKDPEHVGHLRVLFEDSFDVNQSQIIESAIGSHTLTELLSEAEASDRKLVHQILSQKFRAYQAEYRRLSKVKLAKNIEKVRFESLPKIITQLDSKLSALFVHSIAPNRRERLLPTLKIEERIKLLDASKKIDSNTNFDEIDTKIKSFVENEMLEILKLEKVTKITPVKHLETEFLSPHSFEEDATLAKTHMHLSLIGTLLEVPNEAWEHVPLQELASSCYGYEEKIIETLMSHLDENRSKWFLSYYHAKKTGNEHFRSFQTEKARKQMLQWIEHQKAHAKKAA